MEKSIEKSLFDEHVLMKMENATMRRRYMHNRLAFQSPLLRKIKEKVREHSPLDEAFTLQAKPVRGR